MVAINTSKQQALTHSYVLSILDYNSETGIFTWKKRMSSKAMPGDKAGCMTPTGYIALSIDKHIYYAHRLAWFYYYTVWPTQQIDHIDQNKQNNAIANLRNVDQFTNCHNRNITQSNTSGYKGVSYNQSRNRWTASIKINHRTIYLGSFIEKKYAIKARQEAELKYLQGLSK
jgi:hypothetical protein